MIMQIQLPKPKADFPYRIVTKAEMETANGVAWTADLYLYKDIEDIAVIGSVEQEGNGGCDMVYIVDPEHRKAWREAVEQAFDGNEEDATWWLVIEEEDYL